MIFLFGILCWLFLFKTFNNERVNIPYKIRGGGGGGVSTTTYYNYQLQLAHQSIDPNYPIYVYDAYGVLVYTVEPHSSSMNYGTGIFTVPGSSQNTTIESVSTATYQVSYSTDDINIDYENAVFYLNESLVPKPTSVTVWGTFQYFTTFTAANDTGKIIDGNWNTQMQTVFYAPPPQDYQYAILDLGSIKDVQALDLVCGYFKPSDDVKFNVKYNATLRYSLDNINYFDIGTDLSNFEMTSGKAVSFEEDKIGIGFQTRYVMILLESVDKINYSKSSVIVTSSNYQQLVDAGLINPNDTSHAIVGDILVIREGLYAVSLTEASAYSDIVLKAEGLLIPTTIGRSLSSNTLTVDSTDGFDASGTAYLNKDATKWFTYTGKTATTFTGVNLESGISFTVGQYVTKSIETDSTLYDTEILLPKLGDRIYKKNQANTKFLYTQADLNYLSKEYLKEYVKNHSKVQIELLYAPYLKIGQTVAITDPYEGLTSVRHFIETINYKPNSTSITIARYPG